MGNTPGLCLERVMKRALGNWEVSFINNIDMNHFVFYHSPKVQVKGSQVRILGCSALVPQFALETGVRRGQGGVHRVANVFSESPQHYRLFAFIRILLV